MSGSFLALHGLAIKKFGSAAAVATVIGGDEAAVAGALAQALAAFAAALPRLDRYRERLDAALARAEGGEIEFVSGAKIDSYHTVWFELHEELLRILDRTRADQVVQALIA